MSEEAPKCPICQEEMFTNEKGELECVNQTHHMRVREFRKIFSGAWLDYKNIIVSVKWERKDITENPPVCDFCGAVVSAKELKNQIGRHSVSLRAFHANKSGEFSEKLTELYDKIRKKKLNLEEAFEAERLLMDTYKPKTSQERFVAATSGTVSIDCPKCAKRMGIVEVTVKAKPEARPERPSITEYVKLDLTKEQERMAKEYFNLKTTISEWLEGTDGTKQLIEKLEPLKRDIAKLPYIRTCLSVVSNLNANVHSVIEALQRDVQVRPDQLFMLLKEPPLPRVSPTAELLERERKRKPKRKGRRISPFIRVLKRR